MAAEQKSSKKKICFILAAVILVLMFLIVFIPNYFAIGQKGPDTRTKENLHYACRYANEIFKTEPDRKTINLEELREKGFFLPSNIEFVILDDKRESLKISAKHKKSNRTFISDSDCNITEQANH